MRILLILLILSLIAAPLSLAQDSDDDQRLLDQRLIQAVRASDDGLVESLLATGANPNHREEGEDGWTGLILAAHHGNREIVELLLAAGADPDLPDHEGKTALMYAAQSGRTESLQLLLTAGAAPNHQDEQGKSALHWAAELGQTAAVEWLLSVGVDPNLQDNQERTAAQLAQEYGHEEIALSIEEAASPAPIAIGDLDLIAAVRDKDLVKIDHLLKSGADISMQDENGWTALHWAAYEGEINIVSLLLAAGADTGIQNNQGLTALQRVRKRGHHNIARVIEQAAPSTTELIQAVRNNDAGEVNRLLATGGDPNQLAGSPKTALDWAAMGADIHIAHQLLEAGADANLPGQYSWVPLLSAATWAPVQLVDLLLNAGAEIDHQSDAGWTALILAADQERADVVELLLHAGADFNLQNEYGWTALMMAAFRGHAEMVDALLDAGADVSPRRTDHVSGYNAAEWARERGFFEIASAIEQAPPVELRAPTLGEKLISAASASHYEEVAQLLAAGADPNAQDENGRTALHWAAEHQRYDAVLSLLDAGADPDIQGSNGQTALFLAAGNGHVPIIDALLVAGADFNILDSNGWSVLLIAVWNWQNSSVALLLDAGADANMQDNSGWTLLTVAAHAGNLDVIEMLLAAGSDPNVQNGIYGQTALFEAAFHGHTEVLELLLSASDINIQDHRGRTALFDAADHGYTRIVELLLAAGADIHLRSSDTGQTAADRARENGHEGIALLIERAQDEELAAALIRAARLSDHTESQRLLAEGADPNTQGENGKTALHWAAEHRLDELVMLLLDAGADVNLQDDRGYTALIYAITEEEQRGVPAPDLNLIQRLIDAGTDLNLKTEAGGNAFSYSTNPEVMHLLQDAEPHPIALDDIGLSGLMLGAIQGDERLVRSRLGIDDPNAVDATGINTALRYALRLGHSQIATQLLNQGADPNHANINGETALYWAIQAGDATFVNLLTRLRQRDVELDRIVRTDSYSDAPLLLASRLRNATLVEMLLRAGADPDIADHLEGTALMEAACNGDLAVIELLLAAGADVSLRNTAGQTAAAIAESRGYTDLAELIKPAAPPQSYDPELAEALVAAARQSDHAEVESLLASGADPNARASDGYTALYYALPGWPRADGIAVARLLLDHGADPNLTVAYGRTTLMDMAWRGAAEGAALLLEYGADPNQSNHLGFTPLFRAARSGSLAVVDLLLAAGADLNHQDNYGYTALIHAITEEQQRGDWKLDFQIKRLDLAVVQRLIEVGTDLSLKTEAGGNAFSYAPDIEVMNLLRNAEPNPITLDDIGMTGLMLAAIDGDENLLRSYLGVEDPNAVDATGINTALRYALRTGHPHIATLLLEHGADPNQANIYGETVVYWAVQAGDDQFVDQLLRSYPQELELDTLITAGHHDSPLLLAVRQGNEEIVQTLLRAGANPDLSNKLKRTPLMEASGRDYTEIANLLLDAGADPELRDSNGRTAEAYEKYASPAPGGVWVWIAYNEEDPE